MKTTEVRNVSREVFDPTEYRALFERVSAWDYNVAGIEKRATELGEHAGLIMAGIKDPNYRGEVFRDLVHLMEMPDLRSRTAKDLAVKALPVFDKETLETDKKTVRVFLQAANSIARSSIDSHTRQVALTALSSQIDAISEGITDPGSFLTPEDYKKNTYAESLYRGDCTRYLETLFRYGEAENVKSGETLVLSVTHSTSVDPLSRLVENGDSVVEERAVAVLGEVLSDYTLPPRETISAWSEADDHLSSAVSSNLTVIKQLESRVPGVSRFLREEFGINNFGRYSEELLMRQFETYGDTKSPYFVIAYPRFDRSGAFYSFARIIHNMASRLSEKYNVRVVEVGTPEELRSRLLQFKDEHGPISGAIIAGHGTPNTISLGHGQNLDKNFLTESADEIKDVFVETPLIVSLACSSGRPNGIAQELSRALEAKVIAPRYDTSLSAIDPIIDEGLDLSVRFSSNKNTKGGFNRPDKVVYLNGDIIEESAA